MPGLIQKSGYIKPGNGGGHYAEYIATREGVELIEAPPPPPMTAAATWNIWPSVPAPTACSPPMVPPIWRKPWRRSTGTPGRCGPSSTP